jgi:outer membrane cobalamin receptor
MNYKNCIWKQFKKNPISIKSMKINLVIIGVTFFCSNAFSQTDTLKIKRKETTHILQAVNVLANKSKAIKQQPVNVSIIEAKPFYNTNMTGLDLLKQVSGIKIKQDGGFGAKTEIFINGSSGKQIKYFIDGLPQDNMGETQLLNIYPVEQMERIEVYKGVLPVDLGADALGAAINIITRKEKEDYYDASYSIASFNTNRLNFSAKKYLSNHFFVGIQTNANFAQNNYRIDAEVPNEFGNNEVKNVKRFHDLYKNYNLKLQAGLTDTRFADQLNLNIIQIGTYDEIQNNLTQTQPYGQAFYKENLSSGILKYQKNNLFKKINLSAFLSYNKVHGVFTDTSQNVYNWEGLVVDKKISGGEITSSGNILHIYTNVFNGKTTSTYALSDNLKFVFSNTFQDYKRTGKDTVAQKFYGGIDYFGTPSSMLKNIAGIGFEGNLFKSRLKFSTAIKDYYANLLGYTLEWSTQTITEQALHATAYNIALAYNLNATTQIKASYEHAARLPEVEEAFGDLMLIKANPKIEIEKSDNINVNFLHNSNKIESELTGFYRDVTNIIYLRTSQFGGQYQNLLSARVLGAEASIKYIPADFINLNANITYQDLRNQSIIDNSGINNERYKNARLPNIPYLFANAGVLYKKEAVFTKNSSLQVWLNTTYTHEYFLYWEVDGAKELKNRIPSQFLQNTGISYALANKGLSFAFEINNITNSKTYDNFKVQLPGRAFSFKIRIYKSNTKQK